MPTSITHSFTANVIGGPSLTFADTVEYEAYEVIQVTVPGDSTAITVNLSADSGAQLLVLTSSEYDSIVYDVGPGGGGATGVVLDGPHILIGPGIIALLGTPPGQLTFTKSAGEDAEIMVLVGRDATP